jgi:isocitrate lyase
LTLAGFHARNLGMFELAHAYEKEGMTAHARFQNKEFEHEKGSGYMATTHQRFVGTSYFHVIVEKIVGTNLSTAALAGSTGEQQFRKVK